MALQRAVLVTATGAAAEMITEGGDVLDSIQNNLVLGAVDYVSTTVMSDQMQQLEAILPQGIASNEIIEGYDVGKAFINGVVSTGAQRFLDMDGVYDDGSVTGFFTQSLYNAAICAAGGYINNQI